VDAVQAAGKIAIDLVSLDADTLSVSAHKLGGPQGVGAAVFGPRASVARQLHGGGQERGARGGTENVSGIAGFGAAAPAAGRDLAGSAVQAAGRDAAAARLVAEAGVRIMGGEAARTANTLCFGATGFPAELQVMALDLEGVMISAGAACSSGKVKPSHVLEAMGEHALAGSAIRVSGGWASAKADWDRFTEVWLAAWAKRNARRRASAA
jgi:cysteine desulfurase